MTENMPAPTLPKDLNILAWAFIALGALSLISTLASFFTGPVPQRDFLMVLMLIGWGLMRHKPFFRTLALFCAGIMLVFYTGPLLLIALGAYGIADASPWQTALFWLQSLLASGFGAWALFVLNRPQVKRLFAA